MPKKLTTEKFIRRAKEKHGDKYDYNISIYINKRTKIKYICPIHGIIEQYPINHMKGHGCYKCHNNGKNTLYNFIKKSNLLHKNKYNYDKVIYINAKSKVIINCPLHGDFEQRPNDHLNGNGCIKCSGRYNKKEEFITNSNIIHNNKYDYSLVDYTNNKTKVEIICPIHGIFEQRPDNHIHGNGCPLCNESNGEKKIRIFLEHKNIKYEYQKIFNDCKNIFPLPFDFFIKEKNIAIEYDGEQHYIPINYFGGYIQLLNQNKKDYIKTEYCKNNNIILLRIKYNNFDKIDDILSNYF
jgi:hypothetical protein